MSGISLLSNPLALLLLRWSPITFALVLQSGPVKIYAQIYLQAPAE